MADKETLRAMTRSFYDAQKMRIMAGNRLAANVRVRLGQNPGKKSEAIDSEAQKLLDQLVAEYGSIAGGMTARTIRGRIKEFEKQKGILADIFEYELTGHYLRLVDNEEEIGKALKQLVETFPIWGGFLKDVKGCGYTMAAVIISELDPYKARHVSSFWKYAGLDVAGDGAGRSRRSAHLVKAAYTAKDGAEKTRNSITFNPFLKTKLMGVLATSFLRTNSPYRLIYDGYKHRLDCHPAHKDKAKGHKHNMALRYMTKCFLRDLWLAWREIEGLPITPDYAESKLGMQHGA